MVLDRSRTGPAGPVEGRQRDASNVVSGPLPRPRPHARQAADLHERVGAGRPQGPGRASTRRSATCWSWPTTSRCRSASCGSARAAAPGGHNGLRSIIDELGTEKFSRLRVGIGEPDRDAIDHVLSRFEPDERQRLDELLDAAADAVEAWAREGTSKAANRFNTFELRPGRRRPAGGARRGRRPARHRRRPPHEDRLAPGPCRPKGDADA